MIINRSILSAAELPNHKKTSTGSSIFHQLASTQAPASCTFCCILLTVLLLKEQFHTYEHAHLHSLTYKHSDNKNNEYCKFRQFHPPSFFHSLILMFQASSGPSHLHRWSTHLKSQLFQSNMSQGLVVANACRMLQCYRFFLNLHAPELKILQLLVTRNAQVATPTPKPFEARFTRITQTSQDTCTKSQPDKRIVEVENRCGRKGAPQEITENPGPKTLTSSKPSKPLFSHFGQAGQATFSGLSQQKHYFSWFSCKNQSWVEKKGCMDKPSKLTKV